MTSSTVEKSQKKSFRKRLVSGLTSKKKDEQSSEIVSEESNNEQPVVNNVNATAQLPSEAQSVQSSEQEGERSDGGNKSSRERRKGRSHETHEASTMVQDDVSTQSSRSSKSSKRKGEGFVKRMRSLSRSRSRSASRRKGGDDDGERQKTIVTVTSCRSDGYYNQKAPGSTSKLPRKAPTNLKLFHELAVGIKDAYAAVGQTPLKPVLENEETGEKMSDDDFYARSVLWEFMGNIDFLLALVDEVAVDTATRGALKDDTTFKGLRDVIKKCNKVLEEMLVRRERRYTLFFRLVQPEDEKDIERIKSWNDKVEKAVGAVTESQSESETDNTDSESDASSITSGSTASSKGGVFARGRQLLPVAGRVRARRATPTPSLRRRAAQNKDDKENDSDSGNAGDDGFAASTPVTQNNLAALQRSFQSNDKQGAMPTGLANAVKDDPSRSQLAVQQQAKPKDELVDVIRGLRIEKMKNREAGGQDSELAALKPDWRPKAEIPSSVPKLPTEYIHRHRLMKQVVSCLLEQTGAGPRDVDEESSDTAFITAITSRHGDKAGNGKTILAVAAIQTVEVRERFSDGIAWIQLGRGPLTENDIRRLYEELYKQLITRNLDPEEDIDDVNPEKLDEVPSRGSSFEGGSDKGNNSSGGDGANGTGGGSAEESRRQRMAELAERRRRFQGGDIEGIKEDIGRLLVGKKVLICLDDVWRVEDAKWFIFDNQILNGQASKKGRKQIDEESPGRILMTTRTPSLLGPGLVQEVFVRILSEHEAVKLLLSTAGRRPYGGKNSTVFNQAKLIVKGCGNSPLAVRLAGSMLRHSSRSWSLSSPAWTSLIHQCRLNLEEASQLRSFINAVNRVVDLSFFTVSDVRTRIALRRCFVAFAMAFRDNDWLLCGHGIPKTVVLRVFKTIISADEGFKEISTSGILTTLQKLNLIESARHGYSSRTAASRISLVKRQNTRSSSQDDSDSDWDDEDEGTVNRVQQLFVMHDSLKAVAEEMANRSTPSLSPDADDFTSFLGKIEEERKISRESNSLWTAPLRFLTQQLNAGNNPTKGGIRDVDAHKLVVSALLNVGDGISRSESVSEALQAGQADIAAMSGGSRMEEYLGAFLPYHLMRCEAHSSAAEVLSDPHFIGRRVHALGIVEATSRQVADLQELRRVAGNATFVIPNRQPEDNAEKKNGSHPAGSPGQTSMMKFDVNSVVRDGSRIIIDEVYRVAHRPDGSIDSLGMAMCLAAVGEGLLKARQPRDAMLRLEEAVGIYRNLLGPFHTYVADSLHSAAKALVKLGETRVALLKFAEAARIYEACSATLHFNSIANAQSLASLLVDLGDMEKAQSMFEEVISMRKKVNGDNCVSVAKTINAYAILLAKHGLMNAALLNYEAAKQTYESVPTQLIRDPEFDIKCKYDVTLINLNIASIRSKKGDLQEAISCYEDGVLGLRQYELALAELQKDPFRAPDSGKNTAHKHLVAALGRIGSLKLKIGDNEGALQAYMTLLQEVKDDSPSASQTEKAKAHIKCATIYRQHDGRESHSQSISHLREALDMYTAIFGPDHKDTAAIASSLRQWLAEDRNDQ